MRWTPPSGNGVAMRQTCEWCVSSSTEKASETRVKLVGIVWAKSDFHACAHNQAGRVIFNRSLRRAQTIKQLQDLELTTVAMESCASASYWGRKVQAMGHTVRLIPPQHCKAFVRTEKVMRAMPWPSVRRPQDPICTAYRSRSRPNRTCSCCTASATSAIPRPWPTRSHESAGMWWPTAARTSHARPTGRHNRVSRPRVRQRNETTGQWPGKSPIEDQVRKLR